LGLDAAWEREREREVILVVLLFMMFFMIRTKDILIILRWIPQKKFLKMM
jgi:hypothetical protein